MSRPRLVASDLDGTLLHTDGTVSARTVAAWQRLDAIGIQSVLVTARPPRWLHGLTDLVGPHGVAICANGAFVYDVRRRVVLQQHGIDHHLVQELVSDLRAAVPDIGLAVEHAGGFFAEPQYPELHPEDVPIDVLVAPITKLPRTLVVGKLLARGTVLAEDEFLERVAQVVGDRAVVAFSGVGGLAEISAVGVTKAAALQDWCRELGVAASDVWAFGDMPNDLPMLAWAGTAYAVRNAHPDVLKVADRVCAANDDDGVAEVIERLAPVQ
ncbi:HAD family hydrolase [Leekyejoonella antrihumi]|uniref:HAD family hydrolase n=1 Tax=Leekyejoonella antrihumi TaxID=1660198 RepID=A0A563DSV2_9MICO|nr:HAD family hydrolase [Leekyejoonella antrihumi]TWP33327.1 HAD family hydrolase [Leekyejoonella antrihumi]